MICTCLTHPHPDCPRHGWREEREIDPVLQDRLDRAEAIGVVVMACLIAAAIIAAFALGLAGWAEAFDTTTSERPVNP